MRIKTHRSFSIIVWAVILCTFIGLVISPVPAQAAGTVSVCDEASLNAALISGGTVTFTCSGVITITSAKTIAANTTLDATGFSVVLDGGGTTRIFNVNAGVELILDNITIQNASSGTGGAISTRSGTLTILNSRFLNNSATGASGSGGGAIFADVVNTPADLPQPVRVYIENSLFEGNTAPGYGGAIFIDGGETGYQHFAYIDIKNSTFRGNRSTGSDGGAIYANYHVTLNAEGSLFEGNLANGNAGALIGANPDAVMNLANNTFSGNAANMDGLNGGVGGAISFKNGNIIHNTFYGNYLGGTAGPDVTGSAIYWVPGTYSVVMHDNIFTNNTGSTYECMQSSTYAPYGNANLTADGSCNAGTTPDPVTNIDTILQANGGPTLTYALLAGSTAIDSSSSCLYASTGTNLLFGNGDAISRDQRGAARPAGSACDKGAYEVRPTITTISCGAGDLSGEQTFAFPSGKTVTINVISSGLDCITVEEMGRSHELGNDNIKASGVWWRIIGNINSGFTVNLTLPASNVPDAGDQVCRFSGDGTHPTWSCGVTSMTATSLTLDGVTEFSEWSIYEDLSPTAVRLEFVRAKGLSPLSGFLFPLGLLILAGFFVVQSRKD